MEGREESEGETKGRINNDDNSSGLLRARLVGGRNPGPRYGTVHFREGPPKSVLVYGVV